VRQERQARRARKRAIKEKGKRKWLLKNLPLEAIGLELEQGPGELQKGETGTPQVRQISPPTNPDEEQARQERKKMMIEEMDMEEVILQENAEYVFSQN
jgi:hypothetical protein